MRQATHNRVNEIAIRQALTCSLKTKAARQLLGGITTHRIRRVKGIRNLIEENALTYCLQLISKDGAC